MSRRKADTITDRFKHIKDNTSNPIAINLIKSLEKTILVKRRKNMPKEDPYLNKKFRIKRINYSVVAKIINLDHQFYTASILAVEVTSGKSPNIHEGDTLLISPRELQVTSSPA